MKIGIDCRMYGPESTTGIGNYIKNLTSNLFLIDKKNDYILFMKDPIFSSFSLPGKKVKKVKIDFPWYSFAEQTAFLKILLEHKLDLIHFPQFNIPIFYPKKFIVTIHDITPKFFPGPNIKKSLVRRICYHKVFNSAVKKSKKIITVSNHTKNQIVKNFNTPKDKIKVIYLGIEEKFKLISNKKQITDLMSEYGISKPFIFYVGVWRDHKNLPNLVEAFDILKNHLNLDIQMVLGGNPDDRYPEIIKAVEKSKNRNDIIMPGFISENELPIFYNAAELFVLPSFCEGFGLVAIESLACGTPVASSNTTSVPEIIQDSGIYFNPENPKDIAAAIKNILTDREAYLSLKIRGMEHVKKYSWLNCAKKTLQVYQSV